MPRPQRFRGWLAAILAFTSLGSEAVHAQTPVSATQLEQFLGLQQPSGFVSGGLDINGPAMSGSAIMQTVTVTGGTTLTFNFDFLTNAPPVGANPLGAIDPFAFVTSPTLLDIGDNFSNYTSGLTGLIAAPPQTGYAYQTGYQTESILFTTAGTYNIGLGVVNVTTDAYSSALLLDNLTLSSGSLTNGTFGTGDFTGFSTIGETSIQTSSFGMSPMSGNTYQALLQTASIPEPSSIVMLVMGGIGVAVGVSRIKPKATPNPRGT